MPINSDLDGRETLTRSKFVRRKSSRLSLVKRVAWKFAIERFWFITWFPSAVSYGAAGNLVAHKSIDRKAPGPHVVRWVAWEFCVERILFNLALFRCLVRSCGRRVPREHAQAKFQCFHVFRCCWCSSCNVKLLPCLHARFYTWWG